MSLLSEARKACDTAYCPYSNFRVGVAIQLENNTILHGSNQENASFSLTSCAERVALMSAASQYPGVKVISMAIIAVKDGNNVSISPCGACRQILVEYEMMQKADIQVMFYSPCSASNYDLVHVKSARELLPYTFLKY